MEHGKIYLCPVNVIKVDEYKCAAKVPLPQRVYIRPEKVIQPLRIQISELKNVLPFSKY